MQCFHWSTFHYPNIIYVIRSLKIPFIYSLCAIKNRQWNQFQILIHNSVSHHYIIYKQFVM